ncbi:hypothetical protein GCM10027195_01790 [Comamonas sediminis]
MYASGQYLCPEQGSPQLARVAPNHTERFLVLNAAMREISFYPNPTNAVPHARRARVRIGVGA